MRACESLCLYCNSKKNTVTECRVVGRGDRSNGAKRSRVAFYARPTSPSGPKTPTGGPGLPIACGTARGTSLESATETSLDGGPVCARGPPVMDPRWGLPRCASSGQNRRCREPQEAPTTRHHEMDDSDGTLARGGSQETGTPASCSGVIPLCTRQMGDFWP